MRFSLIQPELKRGDINTNYNIIEDMMDKAALDKPDVIVLPEIRNTSSRDGAIDNLLDIDLKRAEEFLSRLAIKTNSYIIGGSVINKRDEKFYNTSLIYDNKGAKIATYDKVHLYNDEKDEMSAGDELITFYIKDIKCGIIICYDLDYPEWIRRYALSGIKLLFVPAAWEKERIMHFDTLLKARAIENQIYVVGVNSVGLSKYGKFGGHSNIIDPKADEYVKGDNLNKVKTLDVDLNSCDQYRKDFSMLLDRRDDLY